MSAGDAEEHKSEPSQWVRVERKGKGKKFGRQVKNAHAPPVAGVPENFLPNPAPQLSSQDIRTDHDRIATKWHTTKGYAKLCEVVKSNAASHATITRAICLGLGAFDPEDGSWIAQRRSHIQMAAFLAIVDTLGETYLRPSIPPHDHVIVNSDAEKETKENIKCFYQEPRFAQPDKDFISSLHGNIVESPYSYHLIDENTLVFGVHLYRDIWADALQKSLPGVFVGTGWDVWEQTPGSEKSSDFDRIREMDRSFDKFPFPQDEHSSFSSTCIYWKKRPCDNEAKHKREAFQAVERDTSPTKPATEDSGTTTS